MMTNKASTQAETEGWNRPLELTLTIGGSVELVVEGMVSDGTNDEATGGPDDMKVLSSRSSGS